MKTIIIVVIFTLVALVGYSFVTTAVDNAAETTIKAEEEKQKTVTYSITGEVMKEGTYVLSATATMYDLLTAAGGPTTNADPLSYDTTFVLRASDKSYYIAPIVDLTDTCSTTAIAKCNINTADAETLNSVAGLSNSMANALVAYRASVYFQALEMIKDVPGIGPATYMSCRNKIQVRAAS